MILYYSELLACSAFGFMQKNLQNPHNFYPSVLFYRSGITLCQIAQALAHGLHSPASKIKVTLWGSIFIIIVFHFFASKQDLFYLLF